MFKTNRSIGKMLFFRKKVNISEKKLIDIHTHVLPYVDDGSENMETSIELCREALNSNVKHMILTPHFKNPEKSLSRKDILLKIEELKEVLKEQNIDIALYPGNEVMASYSLEDYEKEILTLNNSDYLLVEFYPDDSYKKIHTVISNLIRDGYEVILAHAERYEALTKKERFGELKRIGTFIQCNYRSVLNKDTRQTVKWLLNEKYVDYMSSDAHNTINRGYDIKKELEYLYNNYSEDYIDDIVYNNALKILEKKNEQ